MLLLDNGSGVLLITAGARLPNRTGAGLCFKLLCVSPSDKPMCMMHHLQVCHNDESKDPNARGLVNTVFNERAKTRQSVVRRHRTEKSQNKNL